MNSIENATISKSDVATSFDAILCERRTDRYINNVDASEFLLGLSSTVIRKLLGSPKSTKGM